MAQYDATPQAGENLASELRRGVLVLAVLSQLHAAQYGYSLKQDLAAAGLEIPEGTLYPLLRRLEAQGLVQSEWRMAGDVRPRRYYVLDAQGEAVLAQLAAEWRALAAALDRLLDEREDRQ
jgi:DNA-binding PadR family transcriptional regulator